MARLHFSTGMLNGMSALRDDLGPGSFTAGGGETQTIEVFFHGPSFVHCTFPSEEEERELREKAERGELVVRIEDLMQGGGSGQVVIADNDGRSQVRLYGSVRALTPIFEQIYRAFAARLAELPE